MSVEMMGNMGRETRFSRDRGLRIVALGEGMGSTGGLVRGFGWNYDDY